MALRRAAAGGATRPGRGRSGRGGAAGQGGEDAEEGEERDAAREGAGAAEDTVAEEVAEARVARARPGSAATEESSGDAGSVRMG